jgi:hypothetical protein
LAPGTPAAPEVEEEAPTPAPVPGSDARTRNPGQGMFGDDFGSGLAPAVPAREAAE